MHKERIIDELSLVFDTHEHFGYYNPQFTLHSKENSLSYILRGCYLGVGKPDSTDYQEICDGLQHFRGSDALYAMRYGLKKLYDIDIYPLNPKTLQNIDLRIHEAYSQSPNYTFDVLTKHMKITDVILDIPPHLWANWEDKLFSKTIRIDEIICPFQKHRIDVYRFDPHAFSVLENYCQKKGMKLTSLSNFEDVLDQYLQELSRTARVIKIGVAYSRSIHFIPNENDNREITELFSRMQDPRSHFSEQEMRKWGDFVVTMLLGFANVENMPVQIHTGLALMEGSNPVNLVEMMRMYGGVRFALFHGSYPYHNLLPGIVYGRSNTYADLCWMPILNQHATKQLLYDMIAVGAWKHTFAYGGDCQSVEGSYGALLVLKELLAEVLLDFVEKGKLTFEDSIEIGQSMLYSNALSFFDKKNP